MLLSKGASAARSTAMAGLMRTGLVTLALVLPLLVSAEPRALIVDPARSNLFATTRLVGLLRFLGHQHAVLATEWSADLTFDAEDPTRSQLRLQVPVRGLRIDTDRGIALAGFTSRPSENTVKELQEKMTGPRFLDAAQFPEIVFESQTVTRAGEGTLRVAGSLQMRGQTRPVMTDVRVTRVNGTVYRFTGELPVKQTDYGMKPESVAGVVDVVDEVVIHFDVTAGSAGP